jgi:nicotinamidase-related amidase
MYFLPLYVSLLGFYIAHAKASSKITYDCDPTCIEPSIPTNEQFSFGCHYAVLNLDFINAGISSLEDTTSGQTLFANTARWIDAVHAQNPPPLSIFTRVYFANSHKPEINPKSPFAQILAGLGTASSELTQIYPAFHVDEKAGDVVLQHVRYYAGAGNSLEEILHAQQIDTVILSGLQSSTVILSTAYRLFDLDYNV